MTHKNKEQNYMRRTLLLGLAMTFVAGSTLAKADNPGTSTPSNDKKWEFNLRCEFKDRDDKGKADRCFAFARVFKKEGPGISNEDQEKQILKVRCEGGFSYSDGAELKKEDDKEIILGKRGELRPAIILNDDALKGREGVEFEKAKLRIDGDRLEGECEILKKCEE
jgi:hypothetical protein